MGTRPVISAAVEGSVDESVVRRICRHCGSTVGTVYGRRGKNYIIERLQGFNNAARFAPWFVLIDLDDDADCAPVLLSSLCSPSEKMCLRVAVREVEAWLLADRERISEFLGISVDLVSANPDEIADPKQYLINLARRSRRKDVRLDLVPEPGTEQTEGPAYSSRLITFVRDTSLGWRPDTAAERSPSLRRCILAVQELVRVSGNSLR